jgi:hypothetical protein
LKANGQLVDGGGGGGWIFVSGLFRAQNLAQKFFGIQKSVHYVLVKGSTSAVSNYVSMLLLKRVAPKLS